MAALKTRGYSMTSTLQFIEETYEPARRERIYAQLSPEVRSAHGSYKSIEWYPVQHFAELLRGIASEAGAREEDKREELVKAGQFIAGVAASTFLKLLMKVLTPTLFAKKIPSLWERDNQGGFFESDITRADDGIIVFKLREVGGYDWIAPVALGWVTFALRSMGKTVLEARLDGWSAAAPGPDGVDIFIQWQK